jgi:hypothetical protein
MCERKDELGSVPRPCQLPHRSNWGCLHRLSGAVYEQYGIGFLDPTAQGIDASNHFGMWVTNGTATGTHELTGIGGASAVWRWLAAD